MIGEIINPMAYIEYGVLLAIVLAGALLFALAALNGRKQLNAVSYIIALVLLIPLTYQMTRLIAACDISSTASAVSNLVGVISPTLKSYVSSVTTDKIGWYIFRRVFWSALFMAIGGFCIYITMDNKSRKHGAPAGFQTGRRYTSTTSRRRR